MTEKAKKWIADNKAKKAAQAAEVIEIKPVLIKVTHAAKYMDVSVDFVERLINEGIFKRVVRMGNKMRYLYICDVDRYVAKCTEASSKCNGMYERSL